MHVLVIGTLYDPDLGPSAPLYTMLSKCLVQRGHQVTVITMVPHYPSGKVSSEYRGKLVWRSLEYGVNIIRLWVPSIDRKRLSRRLLQFIAYQLGAALYILNQKYDVVVAAGAALSVWLPFLVSVVLKHKPAVYSVHDVYPDVGVTLGIFKSRLVIKTVTKMEQYCLRHAQLVRILSSSFKSSLNALGTPDQKIELIYDWVDTDLIHPMPKKNPFAMHNNLDNYFVVQYAGNIGLSQGLELILDAAQLLTKFENIKFVIVGDGAGKEYLISEAKSRHLNNVQFIPFQPRHKLSEVLASSDVSLVILRQGIGLASLPSKTFSIMASGRPILISVEEKSETCKLIIRAGAGIWVPPENAGKLAEAIIRLKNNEDLCTQLGKNGRMWAENNHSPQYAAEQFEKLLFTAMTASNSN
jgi:colanic acid biosynthesis glycosyl transferase WcaI